jgi:hypothetical protein
VSKVGDCEIEPAIAIVIAKPNSHAALHAAIGVVGAAGPGPDLLEGPVTAIAVKTVRGAVVGEIEIDVAIVVVVEAGHAHRVPVAADRQTGFLGRGAKGAVTVVEIESVEILPQPPGTIHDRNLAAPQAGTASGEDFLPGRLDVVADIQVLIPVAIGVEEGRADAPARLEDAGLAGDVGKGSVAVVAIKQIVTVGRQIDVRQPVGVEIADATAVPVNACADTGSLGDIGEGAVAVVAVQHALLGLVPGLVRQAKGSHEIEIEITVSVVIQHQNPITRRLQDVRLLDASRIGDHVQPRGL